MIRNYEEKLHAENRIAKLDKILYSLKQTLLPEREAQYKVMASVYVRMIRELREEIEEFTGMELFNIQQKDLNIHLVGPAINYGKAPVSLVSGYLDGFRKSLKRIYATYIKKFGNKVPSFDMMLCEYSPGSVNLSLQFTNEQLSIFNEDNNTERKIVELYLQLLKWLASDDDNPIEGIDEDTFYRLLSNIISTLPDKKKISEITFKESNSNKITVTYHSKVKAKAFLDKNVKDEMIKLVGVVRELDLDKNSFKLRFVEENEYKIDEINCKIQNESLWQDIREYFDLRIEVHGVREGNSLIIRYLDKI